MFQSQYLISSDTSILIFQQILKYTPVNDLKKTADSLRLLRKIVQEDILPLHLENHNVLAPLSTKQVIALSVFCGPFLTRLNLSNKYKKIDVATLSKLGENCANLKDLDIDPKTIINYKEPISQELMAECEDAFGGLNEFDYLLLTPSSDEYRLYDVTKLLTRIFPNLKKIILQEAEFPNHIEYPSFYVTKNIKKIVTQSFEQLLKEGKTTFRRKETTIKSSLDLEGIKKNSLGNIICLKISPEFDIKTPENFEEILNSTKFSKITHLNFNLDPSILDNSSFYSSFLRVLGSIKQKIEHLSLGCLDIGNEKLAEIFPEFKLSHATTLELSNLNLVDCSILSTIHDNTKKLNFLKLSGFMHNAEFCEKLTKNLVCLPLLTRLNIKIEKTDVEDNDISFKKDNFFRDEIKKGDEKSSKFKHNEDQSVRPRTSSNPTVIRFNKLISTHSKVVSAVKSLSKSRPSLQIYLTYEGENDPLYAGNFEDNKIFTGEIKK